jgi:glutathione S-transferase
MRLFGFGPSAWSRRVTIYLAEKGLEVPLVPVNIHKGEQWLDGFRAMNPACRIPVLETDDRTFIPESGAIVEYLEELHPDPPMIGTDPQSRARIRSLDRVAAEAFGHMTTYCVHTHPYFMTRPGRPVDQKRDIADNALTSLVPILPVFERELATGPFLGAPSPTIADCTLFAGAFMALNFGYAFPPDAPRLVEWFERFAHRPSAAPA